MTELEKRRRFQRFICWGYTPFMVGSWLILRAFRLQEGVISVSDFLWRAALVVPALVAVIIIPFAEDRRLRHLAEDRRAHRQPALVLDS